MFLASQLEYYKSIKNTITKINGIKTQLKLYRILNMYPIWFSKYF